ncbi:MAG: glutamate ligase [Marinilabiliaceae bacterium]
MDIQNNKAYSFVPLKGYEHFEATTQIIIGEILKRELPFEIIDPENNLIAVYHNNKEYIIHEGTISDANSLIAFWISNDKWMTKQILARHDISYAKGILLKNDITDNELEKPDIFPAVVKPMNTDHGIAVTTNIQNKEEMKEAINQAFGHSDKVIVEEYFPGREYRFLVIDFNVRAIAYREPANITGNGQDNIQELISRKNQNRGDDYTHPLLKIKIDHEVKRNLNAFNLTLNSIPSEGEKIYLRSNSNLSTGGDSIDITDDMPEFYKKTAEKAARAAGLKIAGIDIVIRDIERPPTGKNYIVVELNAPAMLSMHDFPYIGQNRHVEKHVLDCILNAK